MKKYKNSVEIRDRKAQLKARCKEILSTVQTEIREMTEEEQAEFEAAKEEIIALNAQLEELKEKLKQYEMPADEPADEIVENNLQKRNKPMKQFKLLNAINSIVTNKPLSEEDRNYIAEGEKEMRAAGLNYAGQIQMRAAINASTATQGKEAIATEKTSILEAIKNNLVLTEAGATFMTNLTSNLSIPTYDGSSVNWADETGEATDGAGTFGEVNLTPKRLTAFVDISKQMLNQASDDVEAMIRRDIANAISQKLEATIFGTESGTTNKPAGLFAKATAVTKSVNNFANVLKMEEGFEGKNYGEKVWIVSPSAKSALKAKDKGTDTGNFLIQGGELDGYKVICTANMPANYLAFGDFSDLVIAQWGALDITVDQFSVAKEGKIRIVVNAYFDAKLRRASSVALGTTAAE